MTRTTTRVALALTTFLTAGSALAETVTIGHFGNPTPMQVALAEGRFDEATGWDIEWRKFGSGSEVIAAMAPGDIKLAELGSSPLAIATSQGVELEMFMLAQVLGSAESLIARDGAEIETLADLARAIESNDVEKVRDLIASARGTLAAEAPSDRKH